MDLTLPEELEKLRLLTRELVRKEIVPREREVEEKDEVPRDVVEKMKDLGFFGLTIPQEHGGLGLASLGMCLVVMELGEGHSAFRALISVNNSIGSRPIATDGTADQKAKYLPRLAAGELLACFALTEPGAGSDAASIETAARREGRSWILNGRKHFVTHAPIADLFVTLAVTDPAKRAKGGLTAFLIEKGTPGLRIGQTHETMGSRGTKQSEVIFEDCRVDASCVLGEVGFGFQTFMKTLDHGRLAIAAAAVGNARRLLRHSRDYAKVRKAFGKPIADFQAIQFMLADMATEIYAAETMLLDAAWRHDAGTLRGAASGSIAQQCAMAKLFCSEMVGRVADKAVQIHGGMGYMSELPIERIYRDVRAFRIVEGTSEIQRGIIAKHVLQ